MTPAGRARQDRYERSPYAEADAAAIMRRDCDAAALQLRVLRPAPSIRFEPFETVAARPPQDQREIRVTDAARRLAAALHLHLD